MECPYCKNEMKAGKIMAVKVWPYWLENGKERRSIGETFAGVGRLPGKSRMAGENIEIESSYCPKCRKLIIDNADLG